MKKELLSTVANVFNGKTPSKNEQRSSGLPILKIRDIGQDGTFKGLFESFVDARFYSRFESKRLRTGDTIVLNAAHNSAYVGSKTALVPEAIDGVIATGEWLIIRPIKADKDFVNQFIKSPQGLKWLKSKVKGIHLYPSDVAQIRIALPESLADQIRIAALLTRAEKLIAKRKESLKALDELAKSAFLEMFGDPVRNEKGWKTLPMHEVGTFISGGTPSKERNDFWIGKFPWISPKDMKVPYISKAQDYLSEKVFDETNLKKIGSGHLLIVVRGMILAHTFPTAINTVDVSINQDMKAILPVKEVTVHYLKNCVDNMDRQILAAITTAGHGTKKFDTDAMEKIFVPIPPLALQKKFSSLVLKLESLKSLYTQSLTSLENLYSSLSQRAFAGELDLGRVPASRYDAKASTR